MNKQKVYEIVKAHLLTQNKEARSLDATGCQYRTKDGLKCAVGCLIPDNFYSPGLENCTVDGPRSNAKVLRAVLSVAVENFNPDPVGGDVQFLRSLQLIHDTLHPGDWPKALRKFAEREGLQP